MINYKEINKDGEAWELFTRDFLSEVGFYIESSVDRGPDGKKDLIVSESLKGNLSNYPFRWLVSCKHFAHRNSSNSVKEDDEPNIQERLDDFKCDGFIGFYSTVPSSGLNTRLTSLKNNGKIKDYRVFDNKLIENYLIRIGFSDLLMRYFPSSYKKIKPLTQVFNQYLPLHCRSCEKDLLPYIYEKKYAGLIAFVYGNKISKNDQGEETSIEYIDDIYWACKGDCDIKIERYIEKTRNLYTRWEDIDDIAIPAHFINWVIAIINGIEDGTIKYSAKAYNNLKYFIMAMSQKVLREMSEKEKERVSTLIQLDMLGF